MVSRVAHLFFALGLVSVVYAGPDAYELSFQAIRKTDIATNTEISVGNTTFNTESLAIDSNGLLFSADSNGTLFNVTGPLPLFAGNTGYSQIGDLDFANGGLWGFSNANQTLFFYDFTASAVTFSLIDPALAALTITGVAFDFSSGSVYLSGNAGFNADQLFVVPTSSPNAQYVGPLSHTDAFSFVSDIDFDPSGTLYAVTWVHRHFYTVNPITAATVNVSMGPHRDVNAMAIAPVPEPASMIALGLGLLAMRFRRRR